MLKEPVPQLQLWLQSMLDKMQRLPRYRLRGLLLFSLLVASVNALIFYFEPQSQVNPVYNLYVVTGFLLLLGVAMIFKAVAFASHMFVLICFLFLNWISWLNGGINSPNVGWMPLVAIIALMMFGWRWAVFWLVMVLIGQFVQYLAVDEGWISGVVLPSTFSNHQAMVSRINVLLILMVATALYDWMFSFKRREMVQRNAQLEATQVALLEAQTHKDEFIASVGHELRTPMNAILGLNGVLLSELSDQPQQQAIAQHIRNSTEQLLRVVNDILDISQLEATGMNFHPAPCQLRAVLQTCHGRLKDHIEAKGLMFQCHVNDDVPDWVMLDQRRLEQVLNHLLDNAIKFTNQGLLALRVGVASTHLHFEIEDSGIGIPSERLHNVFSRFEHADLDTHRIYGGTGLGLAICERLITRQKGRIGIASEQNKGTKVWFELPLIKADTPVSASATSPMNIRGPFKVLLVDDNAMNLLVAELMLKTAWHDVLIYKAHSGAEALKLLSQSQVDLVLMDMVMPDMDGLQTTQQLRQIPGLAQLPVIGLTANSQSQDFDKCLAAGMNDVLIKPIDAQLLHACIDKQLQKAADV